MRPRKYKTDTRRTIVEQISCFHAYACCTYEEMMASIQVTIDKLVAAGAVPPYMVTTSTTTGSGCGCGHCYDDSEAGIECIYLTGYREETKEEKEQRETQAIKENERRAAKRKKEKEKVRETEARILDKLLRKHKITLSEEDSTRILGKKY